MGKLQEYIRIGPYGTYVLGKSYWVDTPSVGGVRLVPSEMHIDQRGYLSQHISESCPRATHLYFSMTFIGRARDKDTWHYHLAQTDRFIVVRGSALFALSAGKRIEIVEIPSEVVDCMLVIPPEVLHCVRPNDAVGALGLINCPDTQYDPEDEYRVPFDEVPVPAPWHSVETMKW